MNIGAKLDHLAVAAESWNELWPRYATDLGGQWVAGGLAPGFASAQVRYENGMKVEALAPYMPDVNDFLRRFLDRRGPGPHHLTFKVPDIVAALDAAASAGYRPVGVELSSDEWKEAFLHPKDAPGVVIQLAQSAWEWASEPPTDFPASPLPAPARLDHVSHGVARLDDGLRVFVDLLGGQEMGRGRDELLEVDWVTLAWPGPGRIRLLDGASGGPSSPVAQWIGTGDGRLHDVAFTMPDPASVSDAKPMGDGRFEVAPEVNLGTRLLLSAA